MKKVLVIGGTGFIGFHIIKQAKKRGLNVYSISLHKPKACRYHRGVKYIKADFSDFENLKEKLINSNFDYVINAGGYGEHPDFGQEGDQLIKSHLYGLINLLQILNYKKIKKFIQIGSSSEYGKVKSPIHEEAKCKPNTPYSIAKISCTNILLNLYFNEKFPVTIFRLFQVYGPNQEDNRILPYIIKNCLKNKSFKTTSGKQYNDFCYIDDVVDAIFKSLFLNKTNGQIINLGSGKPIKILNLILLVKKLIGKGRPSIGGLKYKKGTNMKNFPNIKKAKKILTWHPKINLIDGLKSTIKSFK
jgi:nucleoside-diphosphate-sugar epimerase|tara:strand:+ start:235 stop:1140 length:906 start_codon:yes stop_codon:yes gene_type:complete